jgi:hypothetical protein
MLGWWREQEKMRHRFCVRWRTGEGNESISGTKRRVRRLLIPAMCATLLGLIAERQYARAQEPIVAGESKEGDLATNVRAVPGKQESADSAQNKNTDDPKEQQAVPRAMQPTMQPRPRWCPMADFSSG